MSIKFHKMHGLGNDFMLIDAREQTLALNEARIQQWADRHIGVGFDQLLVLDATDEAQAFTYTIYNQDGSSAGQCGNGARCAAAYLFRQQSSLSQCELITPTSRMHCQHAEDGDIVVKFPAPEFKQMEFSFHYGSEQRLATIVDVGNLHAVINSPNLQSEAVAEIAQVLQNDSHFPDGINVSFMQELDADSISLRVYERGVGETQACGSAAVAAACVHLQQLPRVCPLTVNLLGGQLTVSWAGEQEPVYMKGPATFVYTGTLMME